MSLPCLSFIGSTCLLLFDNYNSFQIAYDNVFSHNRLTLSTPQSILEVPKAKRITAPQFIRLNPYKRKELSYENQRTIPQPESARECYL